MKALGLGTGLIVLVAASALLDQEAGVAIWLDLRESLAVSTSRVVALEQGNETLRREIEMLEDEPSGLDRAIREELDLVLPGESIVYFTGPDTMSRGRFFYSRSRASRRGDPETDGPGVRPATDNASAEHASEASDAVKNEWMGAR